MNYLPSSIPVIGVQVLDADDHENIWKVVKRIFPSWSEKHTKIQSLEEGLSNIVLQLDHDNHNEEPKTILMRIRRKVTDSVNDRFNEIKHMYILHELGNEQELYAVFQNGIIFSFLKGSSINVDKFSVPKYSELIIDRLARLHSLPTREALLRLIPEELRETVEQSYRQPILFPTIRNWISKLPSGFSDPQKFEKFTTEFPTKGVLLNELAYVEELLKNPISPVVLCHNDLLAGNIILSPDERLVNFIDFEYCGFNHAAFDIGNHFCEFAGISVVNFDKYPSKEYQRMWISTYLSARDYYTKKFNRSGYQHHHLQPSVRELNQNGYPSLSSFKSSFSCPSNNIVNLSLKDGQHENTSTVDKWLTEANHFAMAAHLFWGVWAVVLSIQEQDKFDYLSYGIARVNQYFAMKKLICTSENHKSSNHM
ncbi:unnamed protein product [Trichobilharzia szidati]|nr:unnamed protein product [Trichobilharzia szidati]